MYKTEFENQWTVQKIVNGFHIFWAPLNRTFNLHVVTFKKYHFLVHTLIGATFKPNIYILLPRLQKKPVDFDDELKIGDVRYVNIIKITIKVQLF